MNRPLPHTEFGIFFQKYIDTVQDDVIGALEEQLESFPAFVNSIPHEKGDFAYADGKWTVKELIGHMIDTERIMAYRALRVGRNDKTSLPGFEENNFVANANFGDRSLESLAKEFKLVREASLALFRCFGEEELSRIGVASGHPISTKALLFICAGHLNHHKKILSERYL
ncbi:MAG: DinB family protein [Sphingobacteriaceae bacterium]|jgi:hypothetical protein|nr:DinB family protein [Sphingobacteriaceae bacterium]